MRNFFQKERFGMCMVNSEGAVKGGVAGFDRIAPVQRRFNK
jgi:hypothetical protein